MQQLVTLNQIAQITSHRGNQLIFSTIGCIVDITQPIYRQKQGNFITEIKLVDEFFNQYVQSSYLIKYLSVYLISEDKDELKLTSKIGDFVYLHKFLFSMWNKIKLKAKFYGGFESFYQIHCGQLEQYDHFHLERKLGREGSSCDKQSIAIRIVQLKNWLRENFRNIFHPFIGVKIINNYCSLIEPFSIILKTYRFEQNKFDSFLFVKDTNGNIFYLDVRDFKHLSLRQSGWVYLRGVKNISADRKIIFTQTGNIIILPQIFAEQYENQAHYQAIYRKTSKITTQKKQTTALTYISLFQQKPSTVKQLFDLKGMFRYQKDKYKASSNKQNMILQNNYLVRGAIVKFDGKLKLYHTDYQMIVHDSFLDQIPTQQKKLTIEDRKLVYIFQGIIYMIDKSIVSKKEILKIKLFTNDEKSTFFDKEELQKVSLYIGHSNCQQKVKDALDFIFSKLQKLRQISTFQNPASLVLEPICSDELIFRLINTKIA